MPLSRALFAVAFACAVPAFAAEPITFGIPSPYSAEETAKHAKALEGYLSAALKRPVKTKTFENYDQLAEKLGKGEIDLAWITPLSFVKARAMSDVVPIAKALRKGLYYRAVLFVKAGSKAKSLKDLKGSKVAWVDRGSTAGYLFPRGLLLQDKLLTDGFFASESFEGTHKKVCEAVLSGAVDVGATFANGNDELPAPSGCGETVSAASLEQLRSLAVSEKIPNEVIAARAGFDADIAARLAGIFALLPDTTAGQSLLETVFRAEGFGLALEADFEPVRRVAESVATGKWIAPEASARPGAVLLNEFNEEDAASSKAVPAKSKKPKK